MNTALGIVAGEYDGVRHFFRMGARWGIDGSRPGSESGVTLLIILAGSRRLRPLTFPCALLARRASCVVRLDALRPGWAIRGRRRPRAGETAPERERPVHLLRPTPPPLHRPLPARLMAHNDVVSGETIPSSRPKQVRRPRNSHYANRSSVGSRAAGTVVIHKPRSHEIAEIIVARENLVSTLAIRIATEKPGLRTRKLRFRRRQRRRAGFGLLWGAMT